MMIETDLIDIGDLANLRDLGGTTVAGGRIRPGLLWRSDDASTISNDQAHRLHGSGIRMIIDLRSDAERAATGRGPLERFDDVDYRPFALVPQVAAGDGGGQDVMRLDAAGFGDWYARLLVDRTAELATVLGEIAGTEGGVLVHCAAGKDRTGIVIAAVLGLLGAEPDVIIADYARTTEAMPAIIRRLTDSPSATATAMAAGSINPAVLSADPVTMRTMLITIERDHGSVVELFAPHDEALPDRLRARLVE